MAEVLLYVMISVACGIGIISLVYQFVLQGKKKAEMNIYTDQLRHASDQSAREIQKFFDYLKMVPTSKGSFGENMVEIILSNLPKDLVQTQYQPRDINGRIDFTVQLIESDLLIPIDSKFILPTDFHEKGTIHLDKVSIDKLNKKAVRRAKEITKYVDSVETTDFVLMYVPDFVYGIITGDTFQELTSMKVVPTNTSGLLSTIFMVNMQHRFTRLNSAAYSFGDLQMKACQRLRDVIEKLRTGNNQLQNSLRNITEVISEIEKLTVQLEILEVD
ncbi:MAG: DNA recombination protein RmuC [Candidatus Heimdallarchaeota archaeon]